MASKQKTIDFLIDQITKAGVITSRKMFGEYALYCDGKVVAFVCDDQLFVKPTVVGRSFIKDVQESPAYPGSKMYFLIDAEKWDNHEWLTELIRQTAHALPLPKIKKRI